MTTIIKERLQWLANISGRDDIDDIDGGEIRELARSVLASLDAEPAGYHVIRECGKVGCSVATLEEAEKTRDFWNKRWTIRPYFYSAAPAPVVPEEHYQRLSELYHAQEKRLFKIAQRIKGPAFDKYSHSPSQAIDVLESALFGENEATCRTAMLQSSQPVSNCDELPVIGWLRSDYNSDDKRDPNAPLFMLGRNDPSEAWGVKYIPLSGNSPVSPEDLRRAFEAVARLNNEMYCWTSCMSYNGSCNGEPEGLLKRNIREIEHIMDSCRATMLQDNQRDLSQPVDPQVAEYEQIMLQAGNYPVIPDGWISCSERMPVIGELNWRTSFPLLVTCEIGVIPAYYGFVRVNGNKHYGFMESLKYGDDSGNHPQTNEYDLISNVTHWMPLPEPPQQ